MEDGQQIGEWGGKKQERNVHDFYNIHDLVYNGSGFYLFFSSLFTSSGSILRATRAAGLGVNAFGLLDTLTNKQDV